MTRDEIITRQLSHWRVPKALQGLRVESLGPALLGAIPDAAILASAAGKFPASFGLVAVPDAERALAAILRRALDAALTAYPHLADETIPPSRIVLWVSWPVLFSELLNLDLGSDAYNATASIFDRMRSVNTLVLTGLGDTSTKPDRLEATLKGILAHRVSEGLRTIWESPLSYEDLGERYARTGILQGAAHV